MSRSQIQCRPRAHGSAKCARRGLKRYVGQHSGVPGEGQARRKGSMARAPVVIRLACAIAVVQAAPILISGLGSPPHEASVLSCWLDAGWKSLARLFGLHSPKKENRREPKTFYKGER
eukprot:6214816-Pleurochrysis_carterae.AAC.2